MQAYRYFLVIVVACFLAFLFITCSEDKPTEPRNQAPNKPIIDGPSGTTYAPITSILQWTCTDPDGDALTFDVHFGETSTPPAISTSQSGTNYSPGTLKYSTKYYWRIVAKDKSGASTSSDTWNFTTVANPPSCSVSTTTLLFGDVQVGQSRDLTFTIRNNGGGTLTGSVSESCGEFSIPSGGGAYSLGAGESKAITVRYSPSNTGADNCTVTTGCSDNVSCTGNGVPEPSICVVNPMTLPFGDVQVGQSRDLTFTIRNNGGGTLTGSVSESCGEFSIPSGGGAYSLGAGESKAITVRYSPSNTGADNCTVTTGCSDNVSCTGNGVPEPPICVVNPTTLSFGDVCLQQSKDLCFTITNIGGGTLSGSVSESCSHYSIVSGSVSYSLGAGQSKTFCVRFAPTSTGTKICTIQTGSPCSSNVDCTGVGKVYTTTVNPLIDSYVTSVIPDMNYGNEPTVAIGTHTEIIGFMGFDLSGIPTGATIKYATLRLWVINNIDASSTNFARANRGWVENTITWNNRPGWETPIATSAPPGAGNWWQIDVKSIVEKWVTNGDENRGFYMETSAGMVQVHSRTGTNKPELVIGYCP